MVYGDTVVILQVFRILTLDGSEHSVSTLTNFNEETTVCCPSR